MRQNVEERRQLTAAEITSISGAVSGFTATLSKQPIQRLKWIRQVDAGKPLPYSTVLRQSVERGGILSLFRGSGAAICRNVPHSAIVYSIYPIAERAVLRARYGSDITGMGRAEVKKRSHPVEKDFSVRFIAGYMTLFGATLVTHPLDTMRVRVSISHGHLSVSDVLTKLLQSGQIRSLYHGFGATLVGAGPRGAIGFGIFETLKALNPPEPLQRYPALAKFFYGYVAGFCAETVIYPLDTVRRRQQALGDATPLSKRNVLQAILLVARYEGIVGMFKGLPLNLIKNPIGTAVSFAVNDLVKEKLLGVNRRRQGI
eukprot:CAMPEP_0119375800 /NCGR_PEP_ID=MMETSP1334-20130426/36621_1 /TAXON_ID=127549 /ORGANISM="Calcidiscus leptoporus, Strain RCC1130" /LENGTH=314 /DNA_ID=CAMNT_0007394191 /DNA_START=130 /DNA_END=1074 /DNA_ORIENTATION=+